VRSSRSSVPGSYPRRSAAECQPPEERRDAGRERVAPETERGERDLGVPRAEDEDDPEQPLREGDVDEQEAVRERLGCRGRRGGGVAGVEVVGTVGEPGEPP
jgi:hypothetical protein